MCGINGFNFSDNKKIKKMMNITKNKCEIHTIGLGKVMSAGTLLLAAGTKGHRKLGKHCRVMIHAVTAGALGELHNMENELLAIKHLQDLYINALAVETKMTKRKIQINCTPFTRGFFIRHAYTQNIIIVFVWY